jgi:hypothetical protein
MLYTVKRCSPKMNIQSNIDKRENEEYPVLFTQAVLNTIFIALKNIRNKSKRYC